MFYCDAKHSDIVQDPAMFLDTCFLAQLAVEIFYLNTAIQWLNSNYVGRGSHLCCLCSKLMFFKRSWKACIRPCDTNNFTQSLTRKYHHTATESLYCICGAKISWTPTSAGVSYHLSFVRFPICLQGKISGSSVFSIFFPHEVSHHNVRKVTDPNFWK